jgi:hypothetical protein
VGVLHQRAHPLCARGLRGARNRTERVKNAVLREREQRSGDGIPAEATRWGLCDEVMGGWTRPTTSIDAELARQLIPASLEVVEAHLAVVEGGVELGELSQHGRLVDSRRGRPLVLLVILLRALVAPLELGPLLGLLVAVALQLSKRRSPP